MTRMATTINGYQDRLDDVERQMADSRLSVDEALNVAREAETMGQLAVDVSTL